MAEQVVPLSAETLRTAAEAFQAMEKFFTLTFTAVFKLAQETREPLFDVGI